MARSTYVAVAAVLIASMVLMVTIGLVSGSLANGAENDFREICTALDSEFTEAGNRWLCIRDGEVVYPK